MPTDPTPVDGERVRGALSPSRTADFLGCPLLYRFRTIDRLPERPSPDAARGTLVHQVLEDLFDLPASDRTPESAVALLEPAWAALLEAEPALAELFGDDGPEVGAWLESCHSVLERYFTLEDPRRLEPADRELYVETLTDAGLLLRGVIDRVDERSDGAIRVVDYKGLALDTPLPTPTGWTTMADVQVGDELVGIDGRPTVVTTKSGVHHRPCYRVRFRDGSSIVSDNEHLWRVVHTFKQQQEVDVVTTDELEQILTIQTECGRPLSLWIEAGEALEAPEDKGLPADPWLLGAWLGDGHTNSGHLTVGRQDIDDMLAIVKERWPRRISVTERGSAYTITLAKLDDRCTYGHTEFRDPTPGHRERRCALERQHRLMSPVNTSFVADLRRAGVVGHKHIPAAYLRAARQQRIDLLRGLMDTDGWWNGKRRRAGFTTTSDELARGFLELVRTLGLHPQHFSKPYQNEVRPSRTWHIIEFTPIGFNPFSLPRKASRAATEVTELQRELAKRLIVTAVEPVASVPTQCVAVDSPDSLYLCGEGFIPTHNTGPSPAEQFEGRPLFQLKFYALVIWRTRGVIPEELRLVYLGNGEILSYSPDESDLLATERKVLAVWEAIRVARETGDFRPHRGFMCRWCEHKALCPEFGGTIPPMPQDAPAADAAEAVSAGRRDRQARPA